MEDKSFISGILNLYRESVKKLPVLKYSWGIIVVICILALITSLRIGTPEALFKASLYIIGIMFLIFIFSLIAKTNDKAIKYPLYILVYAVLLTITAFVIGFAVHNFTDNKYDIYYKLFGYPGNKTETAGIKSENINSEITGSKEEKLNTAQKSDTGSLREDGKPYRNNTQEAQYLLKYLGYEIMYADGYEGPATTKALEEFQREHNLPVSGAADNQTLIILRERAEKSFLKSDEK